MTAPALVGVTVNTTPANAAHVATLAAAAAAARQPFQVTSTPVVYPTPDPARALVAYQLTIVGADEATLAEIKALDLEGEAAFATAYSARAATAAYIVGRTLATPTVSAADLAMAWLGSHEGSDLRRRMGAVADTALRLPHHDRWVSAGELPALFASIR